MIKLNQIDMAPLFIKSTNALIKSQGTFVIELTFAVKFPIFRYAHPAFGFPNILKSPSNDLVRITGLEPARIAPQDP